MQNIYYIYIYIKLKKGGEEQSKGRMESSEVYCRFRLAGSGGATGNMQGTNGEEA